MKRAEPIALVLALCCAGLTFAMAVEPGEQAVASRPARRPVNATVDGRQLAKWIAQLDSDDYTMRDRASKKLKEIGPQAEPALRKALEGHPSEEVKTRIHLLLEHFSRTDAARASLRGHAKDVRCLAFSPRGKTLATASFDLTVKLWDTAEWTARATLRGHTAKSPTSPGVNFVAFSADGKLLATAGKDGTVRLWEAATGKHLRTIAADAGRVLSVAFSPDGKVVASAGDDHTAKLWRVATGAHLVTPKGHTDFVESVVFSPDGKILVTGSWDRTVRLWDATSQKELACLEHTGAPKSVALSPDAAALAVGTHDKRIKLWALARRAERVTVLAGEGAIRAVQFSPDGKVLASCSDDKTVRLWEATTCRPLAVFRGHKRKVWTVAFSPDGKTLASGGADRTVKLWDMGMARVSSPASRRSTQPAEAP